MPEYQFPPRSPKPIMPAVNGTASPALQPASWWHNSRPPTPKQSSVDQRSFNQAGSMPTYSRHARSTTSDSQDSLTKNENDWSPHARLYGEADLAPLQDPTLVNGESGYDPIANDNPSSYDLLRPGDDEERRQYSLERRSQTMFSRDHLQVIFGDPSMLFKFTAFLTAERPQRLPILVYYLDTLKAIRALHYANAIVSGLDPVKGLGFTSDPVTATMNESLELRANEMFDELAREDLPAYITALYVRIVSSSITKRVTGSLPPHLLAASEGLAEVFCLTDPSRPDNPIVFASEEFNRTTQYGMTYALGRNCRFLQGPMTNRDSVRRIGQSVRQGRQHQEVFLNYRRDGSPFMNLLLTAPLCDSRGNCRYFIGAQVDVSGLVKECAELQSLQRLLELAENGEAVPDVHQPSADKRDEHQELCEMFNMMELSTVRRHGGRMHHEIQEESDSYSLASQHPRLVLKEPLDTTGLPARLNGKLGGVYQNYLLVRPYPALRILFASPSQRVPGILQSPFLDKIGGSSRVRDELTSAFADGRGVTAKVRWLSGGDAEGRSRWIHCTPLIGISGQIGVWMVVLVDDDKAGSSKGGWRSPPPVANSIASANAAARGMTNGLRSMRSMESAGRSSTRSVSPSSLHIAG